MSSSSVSLMRRTRNGPSATTASWRWTTMPRSYKSTSWALCLLELQITQLRHCDSTIWVCMKQHLGCPMLEVTMRVHVTVERSYAGECDWLWQVCCWMYKSVVSYKLVTVVHIWIILSVHPVCTLLYNASPASITISTMFISALTMSARQGFLWLQILWRVTRMRFTFQVIVS